MMMLRPMSGALGRSRVVACAAVELLRLLSAQDKVGPFCRAAADCAAIYDILRGREADDPGSRDALLPDPATLNISGLTVGLLPSAAPYAGELTAALQARPAGSALQPDKVIWACKPTRMQALPQVRCLLTAAMPLGYG